MVINLSEYEVDLRKLKELKDKLYRIRDQRLDTVEEVVEKNNKLIVRLDKLDKKLEEAQDAMATCDFKEIKRWMSIVKIIETRKTILSAEKMALKECRLALTFLVKEEKRLEYLVRKLKSGVAD